MIPKYDQLYPTILRCLCDGAPHPISEIRDACAAAFGVSEAEREQLLPSGSPIFNGRVGWARTYLKQAGLIDSFKKGYIRLTEEGRSLAAGNVAVVDNAYLLRYESFAAFVKKVKTPDTVSHAGGKPGSGDEEPTELLEHAIEMLNASLASELMQQVATMDPYAFEHLVVDLLLAMGYGKLVNNRDAVTKRSGDGGIDGIVRADRFGFDSVYVQAKRWEQSSTVGRPDVQQFVGAMVAHGVTKGLFITTASFSHQAMDFARYSSTHKLVLVDGDELMRLMIEYGVGVSVAKTYSVKRVDTDYFTDNE